MTAGMEQLSEVTRQYARFSRSAAGLGSVLGGVLTLVAYFVGALMPLTPWVRLILAATPLVWIGGKEVLQRRYYQRYGRVVEREGRGDRWWRIAWTAFVAVVSLVIVGAVVHEAWSRGDWAPLGDVRLIGYLVFIGALPFLVWRYMRTAWEFIIGVFLMTQAAVVLVGGNYELGQQIQAPVVAVVLIGLGIREHLQFRALLRRLSGPGSVR